MVTGGKIACIGAGLIGTGWAAYFASRGYRVRLQDSQDTFVDAALSSVFDNLKFMGENSLLEAGEVDAAFKRIDVVTSIGEAVCGAEYIQESVYDYLETKREVFREIDAAAPARAILASSSSGLLMTDIQKVVTRPERCVLVHPFLPVYLVPLVEVVGGALTSSRTVRAAAEFMDRLGKKVVMLKKEVPGYIVNRLQAALLREAIDLVHKGVASAEDVDTAFRMGCGLRDPFIGPLLRAHLAGSSIESFINRYGESYHNRWKTMETWTSIPPSAAEAVIDGVNEMQIVEKNSIEALKSWRDKMLVRQLDLLETAD